MPDGDYRLIQDGHLKTLMSLLPYTENELWKMIPEDDSALFWLVEKTGCVLTDVNSTIGMKMTPEQQNTFEALSCRGTFPVNIMILQNSAKRRMHVSHHNLPGRNVSHHLFYKRSQYED